jgi:hypothetical protein
MQRTIAQLWLVILCATLGSCITTVDQSPCPPAVPGNFALLPELRVVVTRTTPERADVIQRTLEGTVAEQIHLVRFNDDIWNLSRGSLVGAAIQAHDDMPLLTVEGAGWHVTMGELFQAMNTTLFLGLIPIFDVKLSSESAPPFEINYWEPPVKTDKGDRLPARLRMWYTKKRHTWILFLPLWPFSAAYDAFRDTALEKLEHELPGGVAQLIHLYRLQD